MVPRFPVVSVLTAILIFPLGLTAQTMEFDRIARGSVSGRIFLTPGNSPAQGIEVKLTPVAGGLPVTVRTGSQGDFQAFGLREGNYIVSVKEAGYEPIQETVHVGSGPEMGLLLSLNKSGVPPGQTGNTVSVRELSIPVKARKEFEKGLQLENKKDAAGSLPHFQRAIAAFPSYYEAYLQISLVYEQLGQHAEAEKAVRTSVELSGESYPEADFALGQLLADQKQFDDAEKIARRGLVGKPASWVGNFILGQALYGMNRLKEAEASARKVLSLKRDFAMVHLFLANIHLRTNDAPALLNDLDAYLALDPDGAQSAQARLLRDSVQQSLGATQSARSALPANP